MNECLNAERKLPDKIQRGGPSNRLYGYPSNKTYEMCQLDGSLAKKEKKFADCFTIVFRTGAVYKFYNNLAVSRYSDSK